MFGRFGGVEALSVSVEVTGDIWLIVSPFPVPRKSADTSIFGRDEEEVVAGVEEAVVEVEVDADADGVGTIDFDVCMVLFVVASTEPKDCTVLDSAFVTGGACAAGDGGGGEDFSFTVPLTLTVPKLREGPKN